MMADEVLAYMAAALPPPPARVLEVGAGSGELARALMELGYLLTAIDPAGGEAPVRPVALADLEAEAQSFDAAVAVVSLHHVEPLEESCRRLAEVVRPGGPLVVDEFDMGRFDARAAEWWSAQRRAAGAEPAREPSEIVRELRAHLHDLEKVRAALAPWFEFGEPVRGAYLYRFDLHPALRAVEERRSPSGRSRPPGRASWPSGGDRFGRCRTGSGFLVSLTQEVAP